MIDYMLIQSNRSKVKLQTIGSKKPYKLYMGDVEICVSEPYERWLVYCLYSYHQGDIARGLRSMCGDFLPADYDKFIEQLKSDHPPIEVEHYDIKDTPLIASEGQYLELELYWLYPYPVRLSYNDELEVMELIWSDLSHKEQRLKTWFHRYRERYGIDTKYKRDRADQDYWLADDFCRVHGLSISRINNESERLPVSPPSPTLAFKHGLYHTVDCIVIGSVGAGVIVWGHNMENFWCQLLFMALGFFILSMSLRSFFGIKDK